MVQNADGPAGDARDSRAPDILLVVFDDMGYSDLGCYGSSIRTPTIDGLAADGVRFSRFDVTPLCSPTRASLLTGRNPHAVGMGTIVQFASGDPGYSGEIPASAAMLPRVLQTAGYATGLFGKWHLAPPAQSGPGGPYDRWPVACGFDRFFGFLAGRVHQFRPELVQDNTFIDASAYGGRHVSELIVNEATRWIADHAYARPRDPYFAMISFGAVHSPHHAPEEYRRAYRGAFAHGWDEERRRRFERQKELGVIPREAPLPEADASIPAWSSLRADQQEVAERLMEAYAGHLEHADRELGRILQTLRELGRLEDTVVVVMSDNGATNAGGPLGTLSEEAVLNDSPRGGPAVDLDAIGGPAYYNQYPAGWGQASNTPFRRYKHTVHNGGTRSPLVVAGPVVARRGAVDDTTAYVTDLVPTLLGLAGSVPAPPVIDGVLQLPLHGRSLAARIAFGDDLPPRHPQYFEVAGHRAILADGWKAVTFHVAGTAFEDDRWELYHVQTDPAESRDRAAEHPEVLDRLIRRWWEEASAFQVLPLGNRGKSGLFRQSPDRTSWTFVPAMTPVPQAAAPEISGHDFTIVAELDPARPGDEGVLLAIGDVFGGVSLHIAENRLRFTMNALGEVTTVELSPGAHLGATSTVATFRIRPDRSGVISISCSTAPERETANVPWAPGLRMFMGTAQCGRDQAEAVVPDYVGPFPYTGTVHRATVTIDDAGGRTPAQAEALLRELMND